MILRRLTIIITFLTAWVWSNGQQINAVPDYVFRNQMSVGRNAVTDTAAYFSIGPRYGANKGFMPPIVGDTATFSSGKRNGLLIFSVQKNKFLYWDSVRVQWSDMAGSSGSYITGTLTSNYLPKATGSTTIGNSQIFDNGTNIGIGTTTPNGKLHIRGVTDIYMNIENTTSNNNLFLSNVNGEGRLIISGLNPLSFYANGSEQFRVNANGNFGIGTNAPTDRLHVSGRARFTTIDSTTSPINVLTSNVDGVVRKTSLSAIANAGIDTTTISTRAWRQKGLDSLAALEVSGSGTTNYIPKFTAGSTIGNSQIFDNGTNVGINATNMAAPLSVHNSTANTAVVEIRGGGGSSQSRLSFTYGTVSASTAENGQIFSNTTEFGLRGGSNRALTFYTNPSTDTERLRITSDGDILHRGTYNPLSAANRGNIMLNGSASNIIGFSNNSALRGYIFHTDSDFQFYNNTTGGRVGLYTEATARLWIQANGRIGINTTTDAGYQLDINGTLRSVNGANFATTSGNVGIGTTSPAQKLDVSGNMQITGAGNWLRYDAYGYFGSGSVAGGTTTDVAVRSENSIYFSTGGATEKMRLSTTGELIIGGASDAGDYKLQVSGNALVTAGKLDITTNTGFGLSVSRSGTSVVAGQINNSNGILYYGAESSTGGSLFTGSSAYAAVIGSGAAYPLQFATDNVTRATINTNGELLINTLTDNGDFKLQVNGSALISGSIQTANPVSGTAVPWRLGSVVATNVQLDTGNYVEVNINGTFYRLAIVTPL